MDIVNGIPMDFVNFNININAVSPSTTHCSNNVLTYFLERYLLQRAMSVFKFTLPEEIDERYFKYVLFCNGWIIMTYDDQLGALAHYGALSGSDLYYRPKKATINLVDTDPALNKTLERTLIGDNPDAVLMTLQENYLGILDIVSFYAERMALLFESFDMNVINSHLAYVLGTDKKSIAETFKKIYDDIASGTPAVVMDKDLFDEEGKPKWHTFFNNLRQNYIGGDLLLDLAKVQKEFDTWIGIPSANTDKRERLTDDEVNSNNVETVCMVKMWLQNMEECIKKIKAIYPDQFGAMSVELRFSDFDLLNGGESDGQFQADNNRDV